MFQYNFTFYMRFYNLIVNNFMFSDSDIEIVKAKNYFKIEYCILNQFTK